MKSEPVYFSSYDLSAIIVTGAAASICPIFFVFFLAYISYHPVFNTSTIDEMISYGQIFAISFIAYFGASVVVWKYGNGLSKLVPSFFPVSILGSFLFTAIYSILVITNSSHGRTEDSSGGIYQIIGWLFYATLFLSILTAVFSAIASAIYDSFAEKRTSKLIG